MKQGGSQSSDPRDKDEACGYRDLHIDNVYEQVRLCAYVCFEMLS